MTDIARKMLSKLPNLASGVKQTFTLDMDVLDDAMDHAQMMKSINDFFKNKEDIMAEIPNHIETNLECDYLKELIIKNFKEFIDKKILHSHFHSKNQKTNDINSLTIFYRHGISKIISKMMDDVKPNNGNETDTAVFFYDEIIKAMEKLEFEQFNDILLSAFEAEKEYIKDEKKDENKDDDNFFNIIINDTAEDAFLKSPLITQDMKEELFYELFKDDFKDIVDMVNLEGTGFNTKEELQDFYDRIEYKQQENIERKKNEELQIARQKGLFSMFTKTDEDKKQKSIPKKNKTTFISEDSNLVSI